MLRSFLKNPVIRFLITVLILYILWYLIYDLWLHPNETVDLLVVDLTISLSKFILEHLGYVVFTGTERVIGVDGTGGLWIGDNCDGITLFARFTIFILAYRGQIKTKVVFVFLGILSIELLNVLRVTVLAILDTHSRTWTEFNHTYTFNILIYAYIFSLWMLWVNKYAETKPIPTA
jgi:exosortase/archaeosortase family protein